MPVEGAAATADAHGRSPLYLAAKAGNLAALKALPHGDALRMVVRARPLRASRWGRPGRLASLAQDELGWTPLHVAASSGHLAVVQYLADVLQAEPASALNLIRPLPVPRAAGAAAGAESAAAQADSKDKMGNTPLHLALYHGHLPVARFLAFRGVGARRGGRGGGGG